MTTEINVTVGPQSLKDRNRQEIDANRFRKAELDAQQQTEAAALLARQQQLAQQGLNPDGTPQYGTLSQPQFRRQKPAAFRYGIVKADYYVISYQFTTGRDLDTRTYLIDPNTKSPLGPVGWCKNDEIIINDASVVTWAGDNTGTGFESVLFDRVAYEEQFPTQGPPVLSLNAFWFSIKGDAVTITVTGYKGGAMVLTPGLFIWTNPTADKTWDEFKSYRSTAVITNESSCIDGDYIANLEINYNNGTVRFYRP